MSVHNMVPFIWIVTGIVCHVVTATKIRAWKEFFTYLMFIPAGIAGPFYLIAFLFED